MALPLASPRRTFPEGPEALELARAGLRAFGRMAEAWGLGGDQQRRILAIR